MNVQIFSAISIPCEQYSEYSEMNVQIFSAISIPCEQYSEYSEMNANESQS